MYEEEYAAHEASLAEKFIAVTSRSRFFDFTESKLNEEINRFPTAKHRVAYLQELFEQVNKEMEHINTGLYDAFDNESLALVVDLIAINPLKDTVKLVGDTLNHWRLYAAVESEAPMQQQPSTPAQTLAATKVNWQGDAKDLVRVFVRWKELGRISHEDDEMLSLLCNSFTCKGKPLNRGTIKTYLSDIRQESHDSQRHIENLL